MKIDWKEKIKLYQKETYSKKEKAKLHEESMKYDPRPFRTE